MKVYAFVGPSGTGKSHRAQMVASEKKISYIIDDGLLIDENKIIVELINEQKLVFIQNDTYYVEVFTQCNNKIFKEKKINIQNIKIIND